MKITCIDKDIRGTLESGYYVIPRFQRPYLWDRENVEEFWSDAVLDADSEHFIGSIVVYALKDGKLGLVDGQQRLTTVTIVLAALRNAFAAQGLEELARGTHRLVERPDISNKLQFVLQTETSYPYLQEFIQKNGPPEENVAFGKEEDLLKSAFVYITEAVDRELQDATDAPSLSEKKRVALAQRKLVEIRDKILSLKLIFIELDQEDDAYVIFETLNTRGKELRVSDLVKNHLTRLLKPKNANVDLAKDKWNKLVELLEQSSADIAVDSYLHHYWLSKHEYTTAKKLYKSLRGQVKKANAAEFLEEITTDAATYREIHETAYRKWSAHEARIRESLNALNTFRVKQDLPMILALMRCYREGALPKKHVEKSLAAIEYFHFMFTAVTSQRSSGGISLMYAMHARDLTCAGTLDERLETLDLLISKLRDKRPSYQEFEANFAEKVYSKKLPKDKRLVQYILGKIHRHQNRGGVPIDYTQMTIEHISPESPVSRKRGRPIADATIAQVGNLLLVDDALNKRLANKAFEEKRRILSATAVWMDPILKDATGWGKREIEERSRALAKLAFDKVWTF